MSSRFENIMSRTENENIRGKMNENNNEISSATTEMLPLECTRQQLSFEWTHTFRVFLTVQDFEVFWFGSVKELNSEFKGNLLLSNSNNYGQLWVVQYGEIGR